MRTFDYIDGRHDRLDPRDRGLAYGDGLFETMVAANGRIRWLDFHLDRLEAGCRRLVLPVPDRDELTGKLYAALPPAGPAVVKLIVTRGSGERGYAVPPKGRPTAIIFANGIADLLSVRSPVAAAVLQLRLSEHEKLAGIKHLCRIEQVLAQLELRARQLEEGVLLSQSGNVVGCTSANLFVVTGNSVRTPRIRTAGIAGVMRRAVIEAGRAGGILVEEADMKPEDLGSADALFLTSAVVGIREIAALDGRPLPGHLLTDRLRKAVAELDRA